MTGLNDDNTARMQRGEKKIHITRQLSVALYWQSLSDEHLTRLTDHSCAGGSARLLSGTVVLKDLKTYASVSIIA